MTTLYLDTPPNGSLTLIRAVRHLRRVWRRRSQARQTMRALHDLSDFQLQDIGLPRHEIDRLFQR
jgi:uncharacterized protein YjiS (DUF1127 family)